MELILREDIANLGSAGDVVKVKSGYGRNYLIPHGLAFPATAGNKRRVEAEAKHRAVKRAIQKAEAEELADRLADLSITFTAKAGEDDKLFGSVSSADIAAMLGERGFTIDKRSIQLDHPLRELGSFKVGIRLHPQVHAEIRVWIVKE